MSPALGRANRSLYHASLLLEAWRETRVQGRQPESVVAGAYGEAIQMHLQRAYGWFLVSLQGAGALPDRPPSDLAQLLADSSDDLDDRRGEFNEFRRLETQGWLQEILHSTPATAGAHSSGSLSREFPVLSYDPDTCRVWQRQLEAVIERMTDSMEES